MPIPSLKLKSDNEDEVHDEPRLWPPIVKWIVIIGGIGAVIFFFTHVDKERLSARVSFVSGMLEQFDGWIARAADWFTAMFD